MFLKFIPYIILISGIGLFPGCEGCGEHGPHYEGTITFVSQDTFLTPETGGYFAVALFGNSGEELNNSKPFYIEKLVPVRSGNIYTAGFSTGLLSARSYYAAVVWIHEPYDEMEQKPVLGVFGCNVTPGCTSFKTASSPLDFSAYGDTIDNLFYNIPH